MIISLFSRDILEVIQAIRSLLYNPIKSYSATDSLFSNVRTHTYTCTHIHTPWFTQRHIFKNSHMTVLICCKRTTRALLLQNRRKKTSQLILWSCYYPHTKSRQRQYKQRKWEQNIPHEYKCKYLNKILAYRIQQ